MIKYFALIRNIGQFDSVNAGAQLEVGRLALAYAENGRGKTTLASILRSLGSGESFPIEERRRLGSAHNPHVVIDLDVVPTPAVYQNSAWSRTVPELLIYDDLYVDENVYSGLSIDATHRQNLNEVILGSQGVALNRALQQLVQNIEVHNHDLRTKAEAIPANARGSLSVEEFCNLAERADVDDALGEASRALAAVSEAGAIQRTKELEPINIPKMDVEAIKALGERSLAAIDTAAAARVERHLGELGADAPAWIAEGVAKQDKSKDPQLCPFCTQNTSRIELVNHYRTYFSAEYGTLKSAISSMLGESESLHGGAARDRIATLLATAEERWHYWSRFAKLPEIAVNRDLVLTTWTDAANHLRQYLDAKNNTPLDIIPIPPELLRAIDSLDRVRQEMDILNDTIAEVNREVAIVKERAAAGNAAALEADVQRLRILKGRYTEPIATACADYVKEKAAKAQTEVARDQARDALDTYRTATFPAYEIAVNLYLQRLNAGFRVDSVTSTTNRGGASCTYNVIVNNAPVPIANAPKQGSPSFRNVLSAGDRNTLALAVFFAALDRDPALATRIVVVDDPMTSLDEHRLLATAQELRRLSRQATQVIVLSHDKPFLFRVWDGADRNTRSAMAIVRSAQGSTLRVWDVTADMVTEHDRRHAAMRAYIDTNVGNPRDVAESLRPILEVYLRASYPDVFEPGALIGPFVNRCRAALGTGAEIMKAVDVTELQDLKEYANRFHHDSNPASNNEIINEGELVGFARRVHAFTRRP